MAAKIIALPPHTDGRRVVTFTQEADDPAFTALNAAEAWCEAEGVSVGHACGPGSPRGLLYGEFDIAKWRNLTAAERKALDGRMTGEARLGPLTIDLKGRKA